MQIEGPIFERVLVEFLNDIVAAIPKLLSGVVFLTLAFVTIRICTGLLRAVLDRIYTEEEELIVDLGVAIVTLLLWFGAVLVLLKIVGMEGLATSLGTATGFVALGIAFALKEMIADTVAGVYLLQDPDFNKGDFVTTASVTGTVSRIDLRKTRIRTVEGDLVVVANGDVEKRWTQESPPDPEVTETGDDDSPEPDQ